MNNARRKEIAKAVDLLNTLTTARDEALGILETVADEEREYYDNMPESLQSSEKGELASSAADALEEAKEALEEFDIEDLINKLEEASQ